MHKTIKRKVKILLTRLAYLLGYELSIHLRKSPSSLSDPFDVFHVTPVDLDMYLDKRESLDNCYRVGVVDSNSLAFLDNQIKSNQIKWFVDIGTNQGMYSLYLLKNNPQIDVLNIEPDPYHLMKYKKNLQLNSLIPSRVHLYEGAVSANTDVKQVELMLNDAGNRAGSSVIKDQRPFTKKQVNTIISVQSRVLEDLINNFNVTESAAWKIDIEGYEYQVLKTFFDSATRSLWPKVIVTEAMANDIDLAGGSPVVLLIQKGYRLVGGEEVNYFFVRD